MQASAQGRSSSALPGAGRGWAILPFREPAGGGDPALPGAGGGWAMGLQSLPRPYRHTNKLALGPHEPRRWPDPISPFVELPVLTEEMGGSRARPRAGTPEARQAATATIGKTRFVCASRKCAGRTALDGPAAGGGSFPTGVSPCTAQKARP